MPKMTGIDIAHRQVTAVNRHSGKEHTLTADAIVNAAGPWVTAESPAGPASR